jgi:ubiquinone/menaquinone biosynthesis C-methylase UbiE
MLNSKLAQKLYDKTSDIYNSRYRSVQFEKYSRSLKNIDLSGKTLDLGSGTGLLSKFLKKKLISIDISQKMLIKSNSKNVQGDMVKLPFKDNSFDTVLSFSALMNSNSPQKTINEVCRILKPKGVFIVTYLKDFDFTKDLQRKFKIKESIDCGEDICFRLYSNK